MGIFGMFVRTKINNCNNKWDGCSICFSRQNPNMFFTHFEKMFINGSAWGKYPVIKWNETIEPMQC